MKIVYCHNYYRHRGGEDVSFEHDLEMLRDEGHEVIPFIRDNHQLGQSQWAVAMDSIWNRAAANEMTDLLAREKPDLLHCNNLFPQISVSVYAAARRAGVPIVQALRNYRSFCANSFFYRDGKVCTDCLKSPAAFAGVRHRCYRDSAAASGVVAASQLFYRLMRIQKRYVDAFITPTEFSRSIHIEGGFDPSKLFVRSNFILPDLGPTQRIGEPHAGREAVFVGRLSQEKGVDTVIDAWIQHDLPMPLRIIGEGPFEDQLREHAGNHPHICFDGQLPTEEVLRRIGDAACLLMPSRWFETFGRTIAEAFSRGTPVIASDLGAMAELVDASSGMRFEAGNATSLANAVQAFLALDEGARCRLRTSTRRRYENSYSRRQSYRQLLQAYRHTLQARGLTVTQQDGSVQMARAH